MRHVRAKAFFDRLLVAQKENHYPYNIIERLQIPKNLPSELVLGGIEHARFLFCVCYYMRGGIKSDVAMRALSALYDYRPGVFEPSYFMKGTEQGHIEEMKSLLMRFHLNFKSSEIARIWVLNAKKLERFWEGNPLNFFKKAESFRQVGEILMYKERRDELHKYGFHGFQEKMVSMLIHFLREASLIDAFAFPVPVDFHVLRLMIAHRLIEVKNHTKEMNLYEKEVLEAARELTYTYCRKNAVNPVELCDCLWYLSRTICHLHPGNASRVGKRNGRNTEINAEVITWSKSQVDRYKRSCEVCPVQTTCVYNIPAAEYYVRGKIELRGKRQRPPQGTFRFA